MLVHACTQCTQPLAPVPCTIPERKRVTEVEKKTRERKREREGKGGRSLVEEEKNSQGSEGRGNGETMQFSS